MNQGQLNKSFSRLFLVYLFGNAATGLLNFLLLPLYTFYLGGWGLGVLALLQITGQVASLAVSSPVCASLNRYYFKPTHKNKQKALAGSLLLFLTIKSALLAIVFYLMADMICINLIGYENGTPLVRAYAIIIFLTPLQEFFFTFLRLNRKGKKYVIISMARTLLWFLLVLGLLIGYQVGLAAPVTAEIAALLFVIVWLFLTTRKDMCTTFNKGLIKESLSYGYPLLISNYANLMVQMGDRYLIRFLDSIQGVGLYSFANSMSSPVKTIFMIPLKHALDPVAFKAEEEINSQKFFLSRTATYFVFLSMTLWLGLSVFAKDLTTLIAKDEAFIEAWPLFPTLAFTWILHGLIQFLNKGMIMKNRTGLLSCVVCLTAFVNIGLNVALIPVMGYQGAAWATLFSYVIWCIGSNYFSSKLYGLYFEWKRISTLAFLAILMAWGTYALEDSVTDAWVWPMKLSVPFLYIIALAFIGFFNHEEKAWLKETRQQVKGKGVSQVLKSLISKNHK